MLVKGELKGAQLELLNADPVPTSLGRMYLDKTDALHGIFKFYDGSTWQQVATKQASPLITQTTLSLTKTVVDWSLGRNQKIILSENTVIGFINPQPGEFHNLTIEQANWGTNDQGQYCYSFDLPDQAVQTFEYQPVSPILNGRVRLYSWFYTPGIQGGYSTVNASTVANPSVAPATTGAGLNISPDGKSLAMGQTSSPFINYYKLFDDPLTQGQGPFGVKNATTPTAAAAALVGNAFSPDGKIIFGVSGTTPFLQGWLINAEGVGISALANPGTLPAGAAKCVDVSPDGLFVGVGHATSPFMSIYPYSNASFGAKLANPLSLPAAQVNAMAWAPTGDFIAVASQTSPFIEVYLFTGGSQIFGNIGFKIAPPINLPNGGPPAALGKGISWHPSGNFIAMVSSVFPYLYVVPFDRFNLSFGVALVNGFEPIAQCNAVQFSPCGNYLAVACDTSPGLYVYDFSTGAIGTPLAFTGGSPPNAKINDIVFDKKGEILYALNGTSAQVYAYKMPKKPANYLRTT